jgi:hypothetical protein
MMRDQRYVFLVALHELIEYELCRMKGITDAEVVRFDTKFEKERSVGLRDSYAEPGDDSRAPYNAEHGFATMIEKIVAEKMGVKWSAYEKTVMTIGRSRKNAVSKQTSRSRRACGRIRRRGTVLSTNTSRPEELVPFVPRASYPRATTWPGKDSGI